MDEKTDCNALPLWLFYALLVLWLAMCQGLHAAEASVRLNPTGRDIELTSLLRMSDTILGEAHVTLTAEDALLLPKVSTIVLLEDVVIPQALNILREVPGDTLTPQDFRAAGLDLTFDMSSLECIVTVPHEVSLTRSISLMQEVVAADVVEPEFLSGFINLNLLANENQTLLERHDRQSFYGARIESALNIGELNFEYESVFENPSIEASRYRREGTRLNIDFREQGTRFVVGDMYNSGVGFQEGSDVLGVGITRDFRLIPTRNARPTASQQFTLLRASEVDVIIDGVVVERLSLGAGSYDLSEIPLAQGTNDVQLVITNSAGQRELIQFSVATGNDLLAVGEYEYSLMYGVPRVFEQNELDYRFDEEILHGYFEIGLTPWLTVGINGQQREALHQFGGSILFASGLGITELAASRSSDFTNRQGEAYRIAYDAIFPKGNIWQPQFSVVYEYLSPDFVGISRTRSDSVFDIEPVFNSTNHFVSAFGSLQLSEQLRGALSFNYRKGEESNDELWTLSPGLSGRFFNTPASWSARINFKHHSYEDHEWGLGLTLSWPFSKATRTVGRYASTDDELAVQTTYQQHIGNTGGISAYAGVKHNRDSDADIDAGVNYSANRFQIIADHGTRLQSLSEDLRMHNTRVELSSSLAFAGDQLTMGRPVREAFAIVSKHRSLKENQLAIAPTADGEYARVFGYGEASVLVPDLVAYSQQLIDFDVQNLPPGYDLGDGAFWVNPAYRRGYQLKVGSDSVLTVIGKILNTNSKAPLALVAGVAKYLGKEEQAAVEFFTNRNGVFALSGLRPGRYRLTLDTAEQQTLDITLEESSTALIRLGELHVDQN